MNENILRRIRRSYLLELEDYKNCPPEYKLSGLWEYEYKPQDIDKQLENFGSDKITNGFSLVNNTPRIKRMKKQYILWKDLTNLPNISLNYPQKFGLKGINTIIGDSDIEIFIIPTAMRMSHYAMRIKELTDGNVLEVGGGYGGVAYHLFKDMNFNKTYLGFDIPHVSLVAKYFLMNMFPDKKFLLYGEDKLKNYKKYDIVLLPHYVLPKIKNKCCDLVFNAHSFPEVDYNQVNEYMKQIDRIKPKYLLHFNHDDQSFFEKTRKEFEKGQKKLFNMKDIKPKNYKKIGKWVETLSDSEEIKYYEYLYEKNNRRFI